MMCKYACNHIDRKVNDIHSELKRMQKCVYVVRIIFGLHQHQVFSIGHSPNHESLFFTITVEIHARSLVKFYCQFADRHSHRHMNLKFMRRVSKRERAIRQFVVVKHKLMSVFNAPVLLLTMNFVITLSK